MNKDPAILFYTSDFLTGTAFMTDEQVGIYIKLLCLQHQHGGVLGKEFFNRIVKDHKEIRDKFIETEEGMYNDRMIREMAKRADKSKSLSINAKKRWNNAKDMQKHSKSKNLHGSLHMPIESASEDENVIERVKYLEYVLLTKEEHKKLIDRFGPQGTDDYIKRLNNYIGSKGKKYKSHYHTILVWADKDKPDLHARPTQAQINTMVSMEKFRKASHEQASV